MSDAYRELRNEFESTWNELADAERRTLAAIARGPGLLTNKAILDELGLARSTAGERSQPYDAPVKIAAATFYVFLMVAVVAMIDAGVAEAAAGLSWTVASLCLGWITRWPWLALLPLLAIPLAVPFGYPEGWSGHDILPLWFGVVGPALSQAVLVLIGFGGRHFYERFRSVRA